MKTILKQTIFTLFFAFAFSGIQATDFGSLAFDLNANENSMKLESWMLRAEVFSPDNTDAGSSTVVDIAVENPDFSILVSAVTKAGLAEALSAEGPFTVFAPTNDAFEKLFTQLGITGVKDLTSEQLVPILTYHVVPAKVMASDLTNTSVSTLNEENKLTVDLSDGVKINDSNVVSADITGSNGVIHVIDKVLIP